MTERQGRGLTPEVAGHSNTEDELAELGYDVHRPYEAATTASSRRMAEQALANIREHEQAHPQDPRLRAGNPEMHRRDAIVAELRAAGYVAGQGEDLHAVAARLDQNHPRYREHLAAAVARSKDRPQPEPSTARRMAAQVALGQAGRPAPYRVPTGDR